MGKYQVFQPGEYLSWEQAYVDERLAIARGEIPATGGPGGPGGPSGPREPQPYTEAQILSYNRKWDPYNPLFNDPEYARAQGLPGVPALPGFAQPQGGPRLAFPKDIANDFYYTHDGGSFEINRHIYAGDLLTGQNTGCALVDVTSPDSDIRIWRLESRGESVDQNGQVVLAGGTCSRDAYRKIIDGSTPKTFSENMEEWTEYLPPARVNSDEDWDRIRELWEQEVIRGEDTLYWEDVEIGYEAPKTCSGPITYMDMVSWYGGMGISRRQLCDKEGLKTTFRDRYGNYLAEPCCHYGGRNVPGARMVWYNDTGAHHVYRTITNFIGNQGRVSRYSWYFFPFYRELQGSTPAAEMFNKVPGMEGRDCDRHGSESDVCIGRAVVTGKYINAKGEHVIEIAAWGEDLDGHIVQACPSEAVLPSRENLL